MLMDGKKPKRPDIQIYRPPRSKDRTADVEAAVENTSKPNENDRGGEERHVRSRVFRRNPYSQNRRRVGKGPAEDARGFDVADDIQDDGGGGGRGGGREKGREKGKEEEMRGDGGQEQKGEWKKEKENNFGSSTRGRGKGRAEPGSAGGGRPRNEEVVGKGRGRGDDEGRRGGRGGGRAAQRFPRWPQHGANQWNEFCYDWDPTGEIYGDYYFDYEEVSSYHPRRGGPTGRRGSRREGTTEEQGKEENLRRGPQERQRTQQEQGKEENPRRGPHERQRTQQEQGKEENLRRGPQEQGKEENLRRGPQERQRTQQEQGKEENLRRGPQEQGKEETLRRGPQERQRTQQEQGKEENVRRGPQERQRTQQEQGKEENLRRGPQEQGKDETPRRGPQERQRTQQEQGKEENLRRGPQERQRTQQEQSKEENLRRGPQERQRTQQEQGKEENVRRGPQERRRGPQEQGSRMDNRRGPTDQSKEEGNRKATQDRRYGGHHEELTEQANHRRRGPQNQTFEEENGRDYQERRRGYGKQNTFEEDYSRGYPEGKEENPYGRDRRRWFPEQNSEEDGRPNPQNRRRQKRDEEETAEEEEARRRAGQRRPQPEVGERPRSRQEEASRKEKARGRDRGKAREPEEPSSARPVRRPPVSALPRSALLEEEFREDQRLFNPYARSPNAPSHDAPSAPGGPSGSHPHASGLLRLPANVDLTSREGDRPVVVVRPNQVTEAAPGRVPMPAAFPPPLRAAPGLLPAPAGEFWSHNGPLPGPSFPPPVEMAWQEICDLDLRLSSLLTRSLPAGLSGEGPLAKAGWWSDVCALRSQLMQRHAALLMSDLELCNQRAAEQCLWKTAFYTVIDALKKALDANRRADLVEVALQIINDGDTFFTSCIRKLSARYRVDIEAVWNNGYLPEEAHTSRSSRLALLSAQKLLLFLGDLARYRELINGTNSYGMARTWYLRAQQLAPKNGRPYHQLAVLAMYTKRQMDAMYYYMRSLACGNPFLSASQALIALFDEVRRKVRDASRSREKASSSSRGGSAPGGGRQAVRLEIWIHPKDGRRSQKRVDSGEEKSAEEELQLLSFMELYKRFCLSFMHSHGMLFTRIGLETFPERCALLLREFRALLQHTPCAFNADQLLQLALINIFNIDRAFAQQPEGGFRSVLCEQATRLGIDMFALIVERACELLKPLSLQAEPSLSSVPASLRPLLPALCLWTDWMVMHPQTWQPPPSLLDPNLAIPVQDEWESLARLCTRLEAVVDGLRDTPEVAASSERHRLSADKVGALVLSEERMAEGFTPMLGQEAQLYLFAEGRHDSEAVQDYLRLDKLALFGEFLCGLSQPYLEFDVSTRKYRSLVPSLASEKATEAPAAATEEAAGSLEGGGTEGGAQQQQGGEEGGPGGEIEELRRRKADLEKQLLEKEAREALVRSVLAEGSQRLIELEIVPLFALPDTNCYIDHLPEIRRLVTSKLFTVILPIIVLNELDGLCRADDGSETARLIAARAKESVAFLEEEFERRNSHIKAVTSKGTHLETIAFRSETISVEGNNDDIILTCCLHFCHDKARDFMPRTKDEPYRLYREVVLLTSDRNLRLKAMRSNIPARPLPLFMIWAFPSRS